MVLDVGRTMPSLPSILFQVYILQPGFPSSSGLLQVRTTISPTYLDITEGSTLGEPVGLSYKELTVDSIS